MGHINAIKNKAMRTEEFLKLQRQKRKAKMKARKERKKMRLETGEKAPEKTTIESKRKADETIVDEDDAEVEWDEQNDELDDYFTQDQQPKVSTTPIKCFYTLLQSSHKEFFVEKKF